MSDKPHTEGRLLDHEADGIRELDNALPRWWLYGFYFTILFAAAYLVNYHVLPRPLVGHAGMIAEYRAEVEAAARSTAGRAPAAAGPTRAALTDPDSLAKGRAIFEGPDNVCFSCHRPDLGGLVGPNLTDDRWLHGCALAEIVSNTKSGFPLKGMLPYGTGKTLSDEQVLQLASYVLSKRGTNPPNPKPSEPERDKDCR